MSDDRGVSPVRAIGLIARREINERMRTKSYVVLTGLLVAGILAVGVVWRVAAGDGDDEVMLGVSGDRFPMVS